MATIIHVDSGDEIADLVAAVKAAPESQVALVLPAHARALQTPLNLRLLAQFAKGAGKTASIVSEDPLIQEMARRGGFATFASLAALHRGVEAVRSEHSLPLVNRALPEIEASAQAPGGVAVAAPAPTAISSAWVQASGVPGQPLPPSRRSTAAGAPRDRRPLYFTAVAVAVIGLLLFLFVAPSATVTISIAATPINVNPVIQGSTDPVAAKQGDHILTQVVSDQEQAGFTATPTGSKSLPATAATTSIQIRSRNQSCPTGCSFDIPQYEEFDTSDGQKFLLIQEAKGLLVPAPSPITAEYGAWSQPIQVEAATAGAAANNVKAGDIKVWLDNPCDGKPDGHDKSLPPCSTSGPTPDLVVSNPQPATGGADAKTVVVASAQDVSNWQTQVSLLTGQLTTKINQALSQKSNGKVPARDPSGGGGSIACTPAPALPNADDQFVATPEVVTCQVTASLYNADDVKAVLLSDAAAQLPQGDQLVPDRCQFSEVQVTQASADGTVIISAKASCVSRAAIDLASIKGQLTGKSPTDAKRNIQGRVPGVRDITISQSPLPLPFLPFFSSRITVTEQDVAPAAAK